jgi:hypothetical protein
VVSVDAILLLQRAYGLFGLAALYGYSRRMKAN